MTTTIGKPANTANQYKKRNGNKRKKIVNVNSKNVSSFIQRHFMAHTETKVKNDADQLSVPLPAGLSVIDITAIETGATQITRVGNEIRKLSLWLTYKASMVAQGHTTRITLLLQKTEKVPAVANYPGVYISNLWDLDDFHILYDAVMLQPAATASSADQKVFNVSKKIPLTYKGYPTRTTYTGPQSGDGIKGRIWLVTASDVASQTALTYAVRLFYKDY